MKANSLKKRTDGSNSIRVAKTYYKENVRMVIKHKLDNQKKSQIDS